MEPGAAATYMQVNTRRCSRVAARAAAIAAIHYGPWGTTVAWDKLKPKTGLLDGEAGVRGRKKMILLGFGVEMQREYNQLKLSYDP